ncbi:hypothetical protein, partial [Serratia marcescens]|uniref:hypothetical protein n=1 Tax=Serratia marcescens TaxID=615 RepID=UPI0028134EF5
MKFQLKIPHRSFVIACQICPYLGVSKNTLFMCVPLNANELLLPAPFLEEGRALIVCALDTQQQQNWEKTKNLTQGKKKKEL